MAAERAQLDRKDRRIICELQKDCRRSLGEIARAVGISKQALHYRIERLVGNGAIVSFIALVDFGKLGFVNHEAWLQLSSAPKREKEAFMGSFASHPNVRLVAECSGKYDFLVGVLAKNSVQFNSIMREIIGKHPGLVKECHVSISSQFIAYPKTHLAGIEERKKEFSISGEPGGLEIDETEKRLLSLLSSNARMPALELAKKSGVSPATVRAKMKRLEKDGIIAGYSAFVSHEKIGLDNFELLATLRGMDGKKERELEEYCRSHPHSTFLLKCIGKWGIDAGFDAEDSRHFQSILSDFRDRFGSVIEDYEIVPIAGFRKFTYYPFAEK
ncbi:MAG: Lrp/AsnC family transcriptional regulator [Candidatus Micrarchaeota archaeon]|nr:Lrp/AsnC family transcriptional regulator [Candidatus Micrarchaeota archaeon]